jgi:hypothetical protein
MGGVPDYPVNELESIQRRSLDIIGLPRDFLRKKENNNSMLENSNDHPCNILILS